MGDETVVAVMPQPRAGLIATLASKYQVEPKKFYDTVKATIFDSRASEEEMIAFLVVANRYDLDPFRKEIFAFRKGSEGGGVQPIVSIDGWATIVNRRPEYDGVEFLDVLGDGKVVSITCRIFVKNRSKPVEITEYMAECKRNTMPWNQWPARMLRHKAYIQCARIAFGISGVMEPDEFERMIEVEAREVRPDPIPGETNTEKLKRAARKTKTESAVVAGASDLGVTSSAPPVSVTPEASPPPGPAATAAPSPAPKPTQKDWIDETALIKVWLGAVMELEPQVAASLLKVHGGTRGHHDGCLGLKGNPEEQERLLIELKEAGVRKRAGIA